MAALELSPAREQAELEEYLGERFELRRLQQYELELEREFAAYGDEDAFYRSSEAYLYNLTAFAMTRTKLPYLRKLIRLVEPRSRAARLRLRHRLRRLALLEAGYQVEFADFDNPSTRVSALAAGRRGLGAGLGTSTSRCPSDFDARLRLRRDRAVEDPFAFLAEMERGRTRVVVNLLEPGPASASPPATASCRSTRSPGAPSTGACVLVLDPSRALRT